MKFLKKCAIAKILPKDVARPYLNHAWLDVPGARLIATDGAALVILPVDIEEGDKSGFVTAEAIARAVKWGRKGEYAKYATIDTSREDSLITLDGVSSPRPTVEDCGNYPDVDRALKRAITQPGGATVTLDAALLARLQAAMGADGVALTFQCDAAGKIDPTSAIRAAPPGRYPAVPDAIGVLMPMQY